MSATFDIDVGLIDQEVSANGLAIVRPGQSFADLCRSAKSEYLEAFRATNVQPPKRQFRPSDLAAGPWRKYTIGSKNGFGEPYAQLLQTMYSTPIDRPTRH